MNDKIDTVGRARIRLRTLLRAAYADRISVRELDRKGTEVWEDFDLPDDVEPPADLHEVFGFISQLHDSSQPWPSYYHWLFHYLRVLG